MTAPTSPQPYPPLPAANARAKNPWEYFKLAGIDSPGTIAPGGVRGFKRLTHYDKKKGKGTQGATLTRVGAPPAEGTFTLQLISQQDFDDLSLFTLFALNLPPTSPKAGGLSVFFPPFQNIGLVSVVVKSWDGPVHVRRGLYTMTVELIEWQPPPPASIVATVATTRPDVADTQLPPQDPRVISLEASITVAKRATQP